MYGINPYNISFSDSYLKVVQKYLKQVYIESLVGTVLVLWVGGRFTGYSVGRVGTESGEFQIK